MLEYVADGKPENEESVGRRVAQIRQSLSHEHPKFIVFYVHGWRNDASTTTEDPKRFNTLMAYTALHLEDRCGALGMGERQPVATDKRGTICGGRGDLVGVYIGWPGRVVYEPGVPGLDAVVASLSFPVAKSRSETLAQPVLSMIEDVITHAKKQGNSTRSIVWGHSLGANLLLTGLTNPTPGLCTQADSTKCLSRIESSLSAWQQGGAPGAAKALLSLPGPDLYVLMNPATEATKWLQVQQLELATRKAMKDAGNKGVLFSINQPPRLILSQVICDGRVDPAADETDISYEKKRSENCDFPTKYAFQLSQQVFNATAAPEAKIAAGNFRALRSELSGKIKSLLKIGDRDSPKDLFGPTHSLTNYGMIKGPRTSSELTNLLKDGDLGQCKPATSPWLYNARKSVEDEMTPWDTAKNAEIADKHALQIIYGYASTREERARWDLESAKQIGTHVVSDRHTPFWSMRVDPSVVQDHSGYYSRLLICHFNQQWLDNPALKINIDK